MRLQGEELIQLCNILTKVLAWIVVEEVARVNQNVTSRDDYRIIVGSCIRDMDYANNSSIRIIDTSDTACIRLGCFANKDSIHIFRHVMSTGWHLTLHVCKQQLQNTKLYSRCCITCEKRSITQYNTHNSIQEAAYLNFCYWLHHRQAQHKLQSICLTNCINGWLSNQLNTYSVTL